MNKNLNKNKNGCLWFFVIGLLTFFGYVFLHLIFGVGTFTTLIIIVGLSVAFLTLVLGRTYRKMLIRSGFIIFFIFYFINLLGDFLVSSLRSQPNKVFTAEEEVAKTYVIEDSDTIPVYTSNREWRDNYGNDFTTELSVRERDFQRLKDYIQNYKPRGGGLFWGNLYKYIEKKDSPSLDLVMLAFSEINKEKRLNRMEFAEMVVSCIQDIPYSLVFPGACESPEYYEESIRKVLENCPECCIGNKRYGIQNPVSFIKNLKGDCDTRTVLIYSILKHFNYDIAIVNSDFYRHSILGINLPANGLYKIHNGKKYVLWETTAKYFEVGYLSPNFDDVTHWNVVLTSK
jgi:hypothetical protein